MNGAGDISTADSAWLTFADAAICRLAVLHRIGRGITPDRTEGAGIDDAEVDALLEELAGVADPAQATKAAERLDPMVANQRDAFVESLAEPTAFSAIVSNARLSDAEAELLAIAVGGELDLRLARLVAFIQDDVTLRRLTLQTIGRLFGGLEHVPNVVGHDGQLRRAGLISLAEEGPWAGHTVVVAPAVMWALVGDTASDPELARVRRIDAADVAGYPFVVVSGSDRVRRLDAAAEHALGNRFLATTEPVTEAGWVALVREATLRGAGLILEVDTDELSVGSVRWIERATHLAWAISCRAALSLRGLPDRQWMEFEAPEHRADAGEWATAFGLVGDPVHNLSRDQLELVSRAYRARGDDLDGAVRRLVAGKLERLAKRVRATRGWDDIVLSADRMAQLRSIVTRYRFAATVYDRWGFDAGLSRGLVALFSGPSGTGKTLAAEVIGAELGLDIFRLDLSSVVSKYIGETEKNLEEVFEAASAGNVVLFFDEADALFGKRSEVKDARDRYANIEVSYLLQRLENYDGIVVLATNFQNNIDEAFVRRIHERVEFVLPNEPERSTIWRQNIPAAAPIDGLDIPWLAKQFELSGGQIRNAVVHAAFLAAADTGPITMERMVLSVASELRKGGRLLKPAEFEPYHSLISQVNPTTG